MTADRASEAASRAESEDAATERPVSLEPARLKALAHPLRTQLLNALSTYGPATASGLGERLGESSGATSYHLRQLEKHGFVREDPSLGSMRERYWIRVPGALTFDPRSYQADSAEREALETVLGEFQRERFAVLADFLRFGPEVLTDEWGDASLVVSTNVGLTLEQAQELHQRLSAVLDEYIDRYREQTGPGVRRVRVDLDAFPVIDRKEATR